MGEAGFVGRRPQARAPLLLLARRNRILGGGAGSRPRRIREDVHLGQAGLAHHTQRVLERALALGREADDDVTRKIEVVAQRLEPA